MNYTSFMTKQMKLIKSGKEVFWGIDFKDKSCDKVYFMKEDIDGKRDMFPTCFNRIISINKRKIKLTDILSASEDSIDNVIYESFLKANSSSKFIYIASAFNLSCINILTKKAIRENQNKIDITEYLSKCYLAHHVDVLMLETEILKYFEVSEHSENGIIQIKYKS